jgi:hypothetical protein
MKQTLLIYNKMPFDELSSILSSKKFQGQVDIDSNKSDQLGEARG